ncbi:unnamed protein product, partial [Polarella glacialis]
ALCGRVAEGATCKVESETCFTGSNLAISLGSSSQGCKEVADTAACCDLCASYWPQCLSWQYIQEGTAENGYAGMSNFCCLKDSFRPSPVAASYCESGYQNPKCHVTNDCAVEVSAAIGGIHVSGSVGILAPGKECGDAGSAAQPWTGLSNPKTTPGSYTTGAFGLWDMEKADSGDIGFYRICYRIGDESQMSAYGTPVGIFTMIGPYKGQAFECTLGQPCTIVTAGADLPSDPAQYKLVIVEGVSCPAGG